MTHRILVVVLVVIVVVSLLTPQGNFALAEEYNWEELGRKYMPVLKFPDDEKFFPRSVDVFLSASYLICGREIVEEKPVRFLEVSGSNCYYEQEIPVKYNLNLPFLFPTMKYTSQDLEQYLEGDGIPWPTPEDREEELLDLECSSSEYVYYLNPKNDTISLPGVNPTEFKVILLQYWFFYYYDLYSANAHDGDWEHVTVVLLDEGGNLKPIGIYYAAHASGDFKKWEEIEHEGTHPVVYVGRGSHGSYHWTSVLGETLGDNTTLTPSNVTLRLINPNEPLWSFNGYWGFYSWKLVLGTTPWGKPPDTPTFRDNFIDPLDKEKVSEPDKSSLRDEVTEAVRDWMLQISAQVDTPLLMRNTSTSITVTIYAPEYILPLPNIQGTLVVKLRDPKGNVYDVGEKQVSIPRESTKKFTFPWTVPADAVDGSYLISVDVLKEGNNADYYYDTLGWEPIFTVVTPGINIVQPTSQEPAYVGSPNNPKPFYIKLSAGLPHADASKWGFILLKEVWLDHSIKPKFKYIGADFNGNVIYEVYPPSMSKEGKYDLTVELYNGSEITEEGAIIYSEGAGNVDIAFIIDNSGSMSWNDPSGLRGQAVKMFIDQLDIGDAVSIISFEDWSDVLVPMTIIDSENTKKWLTSQVKTWAGDGTNLSAGLKAGYNQLMNSPSSNPEKVAIMLTDGVGAYNNEAELYKQQGWPVYTVGLGHDINPQLLSKIATETGGIYLHADRPEDIMQIYNIIKGKIKRHTTLSSTSVRLFPGQSVLQSTYVDPTVSSATFSASWLGSDVNLTLIPPDGTIITPEVAEANTEITYIKGDTYVIYEVKSPLPGEWKMNITAVDIPETGEEVTTMVLADTNLTIDLFTEKSTYKLGEPIRLVGILTQNGEPVGGSVNATVVKPDGSVEYLQLLDDNNDGVYETYYVPKEAGTYTVTLQATGEIDEIPFTRQETFSIYVSPEQAQVGFKTSIDKLEFSTVSGRTLSLYFTVNSTVQDTVRIGVTSLSRETSAIAVNYTLTPNFVSLTPGDKLAVWGQFTVPFDAEPGKYKGEIVIQGTNSVLTIPVELEVKPRLLHAPEDVELYSTDVSVESIEVYEISEDALKQMTEEVPEVENLRAFIITSAGFGDFKLKLSNIPEVENVKVFKYDIESKEWKQTSFEVGSVILPLSVDGFDVDIVIVGYSKESAQASEKPRGNLITLSRLWTYWFFKYYDEFDGLYQNATAGGVDNETLQKALELHNNATEFIKEAWHTDDMEDIRSKLWTNIKIIPKIYMVRKAYLTEKEAVKILKEVLEEKS